MIVVTGGAGFIGSNLIKGLNARGHTNILVVDDLTNGRQFINLSDCDFVDYLDKTQFIERIKEANRTNFPAKDLSIKRIFHQGACSSTTEWDGKYMLENNFEYSKALFEYSQQWQIPFIYASSAAVYGTGPLFVEKREYEAPLNVYGFSKFQFDQYVRRYHLGWQGENPVRDENRTQVVGCRYFNVYGPREQHKGDMASVAFKWHNQILRGENLKLFGAYDGYDAGMQRRDFVFVEDVVKVNLWMMEHPEWSGIFNIGSGETATFREIAEAVIQFHGRGEIEYIPFPDHLKGAYQSHTQADNASLIQAGYTEPFTSASEGVEAYLSWLTEHPHFLEFQ